jgi:hypothetical protein
LWEVNIVISIKIDTINARGICPVSQHPNNLDN